MAMKKKDPALNLDRYVDKEINVKFHSGREVVGILKGYDHVVNLVLDQAKEYIRDPDDSSKRKLVEHPTDADKLMEQTRALGITVCRGTSIILIAPTDGTEEIENPFATVSE
eukprot:TRINITY_DN2313_c0_g1_i1.p1 TRINITY_DN2313_c0_g1~~TRINITY_DN2313_c0_g1_i1.p1  ORF type:complete len:112 (-),score=32.80 TRINITY_DN2313_c0_g1_i1:29-364(-)